MQAIAIFFHQTLMIKLFLQIPLLDIIFLKFVSFSMNLINFSQNIE